MNAATPGRTPMNRRQWLAAAPFAACLALGCRGPQAATGAESDGNYGPFGKLGNPLDWGADDDAHRSGTPDRVVATWIDTVRQTPGLDAERGFGGRLYFYDRGADPISVDGRLVVYAFDESGRSPVDHKPTRRYVFPAELLPQYMSQSEIGPSYSVWLPWGSAGGAPTRVSLIARFEPSRGGGLVASDQATQWLPGRGELDPQAGESLLANKAPADSQPVKLAGFAEQREAAAPSGPAVEPKQRLTTTTIRLNR